MIWSQNMELGGLDKNSSYVYVVDTPSDLSIFNASSIKRIIETNNFQTPEFTGVPYYFEPKILLTGISDCPIDLFTNVYSPLFYDNIIDPLIIQWINKKINQYVPPEQIELDQIRANQLRTSQIQVQVQNDEVHDIGNAGYFKIQLSFHLKYLFWVVEKLIANLEKFKIDSKYVFSRFKILGNFYHFNHALEKSSYYPLGEKIYQDPDGKKFYLGQPPSSPNPSKFIYESDIYQANLVFYIPLVESSSDSDYDNNKQIITHITHTLIELFPDSLNIANNRFPRFNFKANNTVYFSFGDGDYKEKNSFAYRFMSVDDIFKCKNKSNETDCNELNILPLELFGKSLCKFENDTCFPNNIMSIHKMLYRNFDVITGSTRQIRTFKDVYEYVGLSHLINPN